MIRTKVLSVGASSATLLVKDTEAGGMLRVLKRINISSWSAEEQAEVHAMYQVLFVAKIPFMVDLHTVMLQNSFLNLVTTYYSRGDLQEYLEEGMTGPVDEKTLIRWLLVIAFVVRRVQELPGGHCFYGLTLDRIFVTENVGDLCVGIPMPRLSYFKWLADREALGVSLDREYPPEVVNHRQYHENASDVWHLGLLGMKMLGMHTTYSNRSGEIRGVIASMMDQSVDKRPSISSLVNTLRTMLGEKKLPRLLREALNSSFSPDMITLTLAAPTAPVFTDNRKDSREKSANGVPVHQGDQGTRNGRPRVPESWHRRTLEQIEELRQMNSSPLCERSRTRSALRQRRSMSADMAPAVIRDQKKMADSEDLLPTRGRTPSRRGDWDGGGKGVGSRAQSTLQSRVEQRQRLGILVKEHERKQRALHGTKPVTQSAQHNHVDKMRSARLRHGDVAKSDIRKHIRQWRGQLDSDVDGNISVSKQNGVSVFFPSFTLPPPSPPQEQVQVQELRQGRRKYPVITVEMRNGADAAEKERDAAAEGAETIGLAEGNGKATAPPESPQPKRPISAPIRARTPPVFGPRRISTLYRDRGISPNVPRTRFDSSYPASSAECAHTMDTTMLFSPPNSDSRVMDRTGIGRIPTRSLPLLSLAVPYNFSETRSCEADQGRSNPAGGERCRDVDLVASIDSAIRRLSEALNVLLSDKELYRKTLDVVQDFVDRPESKRHHPQHNAAFTRALRRILVDEELLCAALPMCAQLAGLQSSVKTKNHFGTRNRQSI